MNLPIAQSNNLPATVKIGDGTNTRKPQGDETLSPKKETTALEKKISDTNDFVSNFVAAPISAISAISGIGSFYLSQTGSDSELLEKIALYAAKGAVFSTSLMGLSTNIPKNDSLGTMGYFSDAVTSLFATDENLYVLRGIGSALDQLPGFLEIIDKKNNTSYSEFNGFADSLSKYKDASIKVSKEIKTDIGTKGVIKGLFGGAEKNLLRSSIGILGGVGVYFIPGMHKVGEITRDVFGLDADFAVLHKGVTETINGIKGGASYLTSSILYTLGTSADLGFRFTGVKNLNLLGIGLDRLGSFFMALGNMLQNKESKEKTK